MTIHGSASNFKQRHGVTRGMVFVAEMRKEVSWCGVEVQEFNGFAVSGTTEL
jgi:hypothetical protein